MANWRSVLQKIDEWRFKLPRTFKEGMRVDGLIYADEQMIEHIVADNAHIQVANVACLPGIVGNSLAMPDIHLGYGFAIGGVAAFDPEQGGIISPGGVGYDINCGCRVLRTDLTYDEIKDKIERITDILASEVPSGVGSKGPVTLSSKQLDQVLVEGSKWAVRNGYGVQDDVIHTEENGSIDGADPAKVSSHAKERGADQLGTLGSGNHFLEVQKVEEIYDEKAADAFGLFKGQITIMIHSGSRGLGHQVCTDQIRVMQGALQKYGISVPDRQLCCAPINSTEGLDYYAAMAAAANYAWCNRQLLMHWTRDSFSKALGAGPEKLGIRLIYDVAHNIAKKEKHRINGAEKELCVHRKGATRSFPSGRPEIPEDYREVGQPVLIPGDMGRYSYVLVGTQRSMQETWGSVCHGAGRLLSRSAATRKLSVSVLLDELAKAGVIVRAASKKGLVEEAPEAYKDIREVVNIVDQAGLAKKVARMKPLGVVKG
jgi:tRNA-splicing ligase RtcB